MQEAAKQCVASRLRTHHGGPAQTLAALEQAVQAAVAVLHQQQEQQGEEQAPAPAAAGGPAGGDRRQAAALLLLFLHSVEQGVASASSGVSSASRAPPPEGAVAFFAANIKVGRCPMRAVAAPCRRREDHPADLVPPTIFLLALPCLRRSGRHGLPV